MAVADPYAHLEQRCRTLIARYVEPIIAAEREALLNGSQLPDPDFDSLAAFRLLTHAELEGYFEAKAFAALSALDKEFNASAVVTSKFASLIFLFLWKQRRQLDWTAAAYDDPASKTAEMNDFKRLAQEALGFGRQFISENNGVKENSIQTLSALMGYFNDQLDQVLVSELNQYGKNRGEVAHNSWIHNTRTFESADIEKGRLETILRLTRQFYENGTMVPVQQTTRATVFSTLKKLLPKAWKTG